MRFCYYILIYQMGQKAVNSPMMDKKEAHRVSFLVTIPLVSWKQTQWAAYYFPGLVKGRFFYASFTVFFIRPSWIS